MSNIVSFGGQKSAYLDLEFLETSSFPTTSFESNSEFCTKSQTAAMQPSVMIKPSSDIPVGANSPLFVASSVVHAQHHAPNPYNSENINERSTTSPVVRQQASASRQDLPQINSATFANSAMARPSMDIAVYADSTLPIDSTRGRSTAFGQSGISDTRRSQDVSRLEQSILARNRNQNESEQRVDTVEPDGITEAARLKQQPTLKSLRRTIRSNPRGYLHDANPKIRCLLRLGSCSAFPRRHCTSQS